MLADERKMRAILERLAHEAHQQEVREQGKTAAGRAHRSCCRSPSIWVILALAGEFLNYVDEKAGVLVGEGG